MVMLRIVARRRLSLGRWAHVQVVVVAAVMRAGRLLLVHLLVS